MATISVERAEIDVEHLADGFARYWWVFFLRGLLAIAFGLIAFAWPGLTLAALVILFGAYAFVDGSFLVGGTIAAWNRLENHWLPMLQGLVGIAVGILTFFNPAITALGLLIYIAAWSLATGVLEIVAAVELRNVIKGEIWLLLGGIASVVLSFLLMMFPAAGALGLLWAIASYAIVFGALLIGLSFKLMKRQQQSSALHHHQQKAFAS
jgi:uncharacterized membrane protein HdeD (DUF308 family)